eukprot:Skav218055  [mRNA]  locus=scaffold214:1527662:1528273:- [translate_table: standard]
MGGEQYRFIHRNRNKQFTDAEKAKYKELLPRLLRCFQQWQQRSSMIHSLVKQVQIRLQCRKEMPVWHHFFVVHGNIPSTTARTLLLGTRQESSFFSDLPAQVVHNILDMLFFRYDMTMRVDGFGEPVEIKKFALIVACPRPYGEAPLALPVELHDFPKEFGWQDWSRTRGTDPLHDLADKMMDLLQKGLPHAFQEIYEDSDGY